MTTEPECTSRPRQTILLGLTGAAGAGKTTAANYLESEWGVLPVGLSDPILAMLLALFNDADVGDGWATERSLKEQSTSLGYSYRYLAQRLGTDWGREALDCGFWMRIAERKLADLEAGGDHALVSDIRFPDEAQWLRARGGLLVRIERPDATPVQEHESERHWRLLDADHIVRNDGSLATLYDKLDRVMVQKLKEAAE